MVLNSAYYADIRTFASYPSTTVRSDRSRENRLSSRAKYLIAHHEILLDS